jgi:hypothetical protein
MQPEGLKNCVSDKSDASGMVDYRFWQISGGQEAKSARWFRQPILKPTFGWEDRVTRWQCVISG